MMHGQKNIKLFMTVMGHVCAVNCNITHISCPRIVILWSLITRRPACAQSLLSSLSKSSPSLLKHIRKCVLFSQTSVIKFSFPFFAVPYFPFTRQWFLHEGGIIISTFPHFPLPFSSHTMHTFAQKEKLATSELEDERH